MNQMPPVCGGIFVWVVITMIELTLRPLQASDLPLMLELETCADAKRYTSSAEKTPQQVKQGLNAYLDGDLRLPQLEILVANHLQHGDIGITVSFINDQHLAEVGYMIAKRHWGKGLGHAIGAAIFGQAQQRFPQQPLAATVFEANKPSVRVLEKLGFELQRVSQCPRLDLPLQHRLWQG